MIPAQDLLSDLEPALCRRTGRHPRRAASAPFPWRSPRTEPERTRHLRPAGGPAPEPPAAPD